MADPKKILVLAGLAACILIALVIDIFAALTVLIILAVLVMTLHIMDDSRDLPSVSAHLQEDAKGIWIVNTGNSTAHSVRVALVPMDIEFTIPRLEEDEKSQFPLDKMVENVKVVIQYKNNRGVEYSHSYHLSALGGDDDDLLKPAFPLFRWK